MRLATFTTTAEMLEVATFIMNQSLTILFLANREIYKNKKCSVYNVERLHARLGNTHLGQQE